MTTDFRGLIEFADKIHQPQNASGFIPVNPRKDAQLITLLNLLRALEAEARQPKRLPKTLPDGQRIGPQAWRMQSLRVQRRQELTQRQPLSAAQATLHVSGCPPHVTANLGTQKSFLWKNHILRRCGLTYAQSTVCKFDQTYHHPRSGRAVPSSNRQKRRQSLLIQAWETAIHT